MLLNNENTLIINDWGDTVITHPFFSMTSFLDSLSRNHNINEDDPIGQNLTGNYINFWLKYESKSNLKIVFELARRLNNIKFVLSFHAYPESVCKFISNAKSWIVGTHHGVEAKYLAPYLSEYTFRFNRRHDPDSMFFRALGACVRAEPKTEHTLHTLSG